MSNPTPKTWKKIKGEKIDRLSALPDTVICHILSFLPTIDAVATSILSTRWKNLFAAVPVIDLEDNRLSRHEIAGCPIRNNSNLKAYYNFINYVNKVLMFRNTSTLCRFRLICLHLKDCASSLIFTWISSVLYRQVQEIDIYLNLEVSIPLPIEIFSCGTLQTLILVGRFELDARVSIRLPNLKVLYLEFVKLCNDDSINKFISGCEMLEELRLENCLMKDLHVLNISSPSLGNLTIITDRVNLGQYSIVIDAPKLKYLEYVDCIAKGYKVKNLHSLSEAHIALYLSKDITKESKLRDQQIAKSFIHRMDIVEQIFLFGDTMEAIDASVSIKLPTFKNLIQVELDANCRCGWRLLPELLESSPKLESLSFPKGLLDITGGEKEFEYCLPEQVPICLSQSLGEIEVHGFHGLECEFNLIEYFLQNGQVLKKLSIWLTKSQLSYEWLTSVCKRLSTCSKSSETCQTMLYFSELDSYGVKI